MKYRVLKEILTIKNPHWRKPGEVFDARTCTPRIEALLEAGYIEKIPDRPKTVYDLKEGDTCYQTSGTIITKCEWKDAEGQRLRRSVGDITLTKEEAVEKLAWRKAREVLIQDTKGFKPDWHGEGNLNCTWTIRWERHYIDYQDAQDCMRDKPVWRLKVSHADNIYGQNLIYFATREDAESSIKAHPNEWKTYLGVEE